MDIANVRLHKVDVDEGEEEDVESGDRQINVDSLWSSQDLEAQSNGVRPGGPQVQVEPGGNYLSVSVLL